MAKTKTSETVQDILDRLAEDSVDPRFRQKVDRMKDELSDSEIAGFLNDRGQLPDDLKHKYRLDQIGSNVSAGDIPEEAPPEDRGASPDEPDDVEVPAEVDDYNELTVPQLNTVIKRRNAERDADEQIVPDGSRKADLVTALEDDDEAQASE